MKRLILSSEQRQAVESTLASVSKAQADFSAKSTALDTTRKLQTEFDADVARRRIETDSRDNAAVSALVVAERASALNAEKLPALEVECESAKRKLAAEMQPVPDLLRSVLSPVFDSLVESETHTLLPTFKDPGLARNAARQTERVRRFYVFLRCDWAIHQNVGTAPAACEWLRKLLDGELPKECGEK